MEKVRVALAGCGNWGVNYLRLLGQAAEIELVCVIDTNVKVQPGFQHKFAVSPRFYESYKLAIERESPDAIIVATPLNTHFEICQYALEQGIHVLCEKPVSTSQHEILQLKNMAINKNLHFLPGHVFIYNQGIQFIKEFLNAGRFGNIHYFNFQRTGFGPSNFDADVTEDLATHDFAILLHLLSEKPEAVSIAHFNYESHTVSDVSYIRVYFRSKIHATLQVSWLHPVKERKMTIVGPGMMVVFDDTSPSEKVKLYTRDRSLNQSDGDFGEFQMALRAGEIMVPDIKYTEPLKLQLNNFIQCVLGNETPKVTIDDALHISKIFAACRKSIQSKGAVTKIDW